MYQTAQRIRSFAPLIVGKPVSPRCLNL